jgi:hypothetical protein
VICELPKEKESVPDRCLYSSMLFLVSLRQRQDIDMDIILELSQQVYNRDTSLLLSITLIISSLKKVRKYRNDKNTRKKKARA